MHKIKKYIAFILFISLVSFGFILAPAFIKADHDPVTIVLDPGHGGDNIGAVNDMWIEKDMNLITALVIKDELSKYEGVTVYLTRTEDMELSLSERADYAKEVNADFLFSIHYNDSTDKNLYGTEIWVQSTGDFYSKGYAFGELFLKRMKDLGLYERGIKTRLNDSDDEWYGILRCAKKNDIPAVLMEHCHVSSLDEEYVNTVDKLQEFGRRDADAIAEYFGLKSDKKDYSERVINYPESPEEPIRQDTEKPEYVKIIPVATESPDDIVIKLEASDSETGLKYYSVSNDNGITWSELKEFNVNKNEIASATINIDIVNDDYTKVKVKVYDGYDNVSTSNTLIFPYYKAPEEPAPYDVEGYVKEALPRLYSTIHKINVKDILEKLDNNIVYVTIMVFSIVFLVINIICWLFMYSINKNYKKVTHIQNDET